MTYYAQDTPYDCGVACLRTVSSLLGNEVPRDLIAEMCLTPDGTTQSAMIRTLRALGLTASLRYTLEVVDLWRLRVKGKQIILYDEKREHWCVLKLVTPLCVVVHCPDEGDQYLNLSKYSNKYGTFGLVCGRKAVRQI